LSANSPVSARRHASTAKRFFDFVELRVVGEERVSGGSTTKAAKIWFPQALFSGFVFLPPLRKCFLARLPLELSTHGMDFIGG
jgi:hypothetical protein